MGLGRLHILDKTEPRWGEYLRLLVTRLSAAEPMARVFVFGSFVNGEFHAESDLDLAVLLPDGAHRKDFLNMWRQQPVFVDWPFDLVVFEKSEFDKKKYVGGVAFEIQSEGIEIYPNWRLK